MFIVLIFAALLTVVVPAGLYAKLSYNPQNEKFEITSPDGKVKDLPATQKTLDKLGVTGSLDKFLDGSISKPIAVPGTYERVKQAPQGIFKILLAPISGVYDTIDIILFVFVLGGCIGVLNNMGAFNAGIAVLSKVTKGKEYILIVLITMIIAAGGTTFRLAVLSVPIMAPLADTVGISRAVIVSAYSYSVWGKELATVQLRSYCAILTLIETLKRRKMGIIKNTKELFVGTPAIF